MSIKAGRTTSAEPIGGSINRSLHIPSERTRFGYLMAILRSAADAEPRPASIEQVRQAVSRTTRQLVGHAKRNGLNGQRVENYREAYNRRTIGVNAPEFYQLVLEALRGRPERLRLQLYNSTFYGGQLEGSATRQRELADVLSAVSEAHLVPRLLDLLADDNEELQPSEIKVHLASRPEGAEVGPLEAHFAGDFEQWQSWQSRRNFERTFIVSLISLPDNRWLFAGVFRSHDCSLQDFRGAKKWKYDTERVPSPYDGRLLVRWERRGKQSYRLAETMCDELLVLGIASEPLGLGRLSKLEGFSDEALPPVTIATSSECFIVEPEAHNATTFEKRGTTQTVGERRESDLVKRYEAMLRRRGVVTKRARLRAFGQVQSMITDVYVPERDELLEAKGTARRSAIREAIGQLFDYRRFIEPKPSQLTVLLPNRPASDLLDLLQELGIGCVWETRRGKFERYNVE